MFLSCIIITTQLQYRVIWMSREAASVEQLQIN